MKASAPQGQWVVLDLWLQKGVREDTMMLFIISLVV